MQRQHLAWIECLILFIGLPLLLAQTVLPTAPPVVLLSIGLACMAWLLCRGGHGWRALWWGHDREKERRELSRVVARFAVAGAALVGLVLAIYPTRLFDLPADRPRVWALVLLTYPASVYPQELVYRAFFFTRYGGLFPRPYLITLSSALAFGWAHLLYGSLLAVLLAFIGGLLFAHTYARTRSMRLVFLEHTLYGSLIFTVGLGDFFLFRSP